MRNFKSSLLILTLGYLAMVSSAISEEVGVLNGKAGVSSSGAATYSIPIEVPPALGGLQPSISLQYNSQARSTPHPVKLSDIRPGAGAMGLGWSISGLSAISRCQTDLIRDGGIDPVDYDDNDQYCLDGKRLVLVSGSHGEEGAEYRTQLNGFNKILVQGTAGNGPLSFKLWRKDGKVVEYGVTEDSRQEAHDRDDIDRWNISAIKDAVSNQIDFVYEKDQTSLVYRIESIAFESKAIAFAYNGEQLDFITIHNDDIEIYEYSVNYSISNTTSRKLLSSINKCYPNSLCEVSTNFTWNSTTVIDSFIAGCIGQEDGACGTDSLDYFYGSNTRHLTGDFNGDGLNDIFVISGDDSFRKRALLLGKSDGTGFSTGCSGQEDGACGTDNEEYFYNSNTRHLTGDFNGDGLSDIFVISGVGTFRRRVLFLGKSDGTGFSAGCFGQEDGACGTDYEDYFYNSKTRHLVGDFNGDGLSDVFVISGDNSFRRRVLLLGKSDGTGFSAGCFGQEDGACGTDNEEYFNHYNTRHLTGDFNGDGLSDIFVISADSTFRRRVLLLGKSDGTGFSAGCSGQEDGACGTDSEGYLYNSNTRHLLGDFNGDGLSDIFVISADSTFRRRVLLLGKSDGTGFTAGCSGQEDGACGTDSEGYFFNAITRHLVGDFNGDNLSDIFVISGDSSFRRRVLLLGKPGGTGFSWGCYGQEDGACGTDNEEYFYSSKTRHLTGDFDGDGLSDFFVISGDSSFTRRALMKTWPVNNSAPDILLNVEQTLGENITFNYASLSTSDIYLKYDNSAYPANDYQSPIYVVSKLESDNGLGGTHSTTYKYEGMRIHKQGLGSLGFAKIIKTDDFSKISQTTEYLQEFLDWKVGVPASKTVTTETGTVLSQITYDWEINPLAAVGTANGHNERYNRYLGRSISKRFKLNGDAISEALTLNCDIDPSNYLNSSLCTNDNYDIYGNALFSQTIVTDMQNDEVNYNTETTNSYWSENYFASNSDWFVSQPKTTSVKKYGDNLPALTRNSSFDVYDAQGRLTKLTIEPDGDALTTEYVYEGSYGRISKNTVSGDDFTPRVTDYSYDETNPYQATTKQVVNGILHSSTTVTDPKTGNPLTISDVNDIETSFGYDDFGRLQTQSHADGSSLLVEYKWCDGDCPEGSVYYEQTTQSDALTSSVSKVFFDKLQRVVSTQDSGFNGDIINVDYEYDARGRQMSTTEPYKIGDTVYKTQTTEFDLLDRPKTIKLPSDDVNTFTYNGLETTSTNAKLQSNRTLKNALGQVLVSTNDDEVEQTFTYDAWGNLRTSTDVSNNVVEMLYDLKGNKTSIIDRDKGTLTYAYNALGELITQTDAKQKTTCMAYDTQGRLTKRIDHYSGSLTQAKAGCSNDTSNPLTATWSYDTATGKGTGQLHQVEGEHGYKLVHGYDSLGRPSTEEVTIATVKYNLSTSYYANTSLVNVMSYPKVGAETFEVKNNYNTYGYLESTQDTVTGKKYFTATEVNARGQLTAFDLGNGATTSQTYYEDTGYPEFIDTQRNTTTLQYLSYGFDALGNLEYRQEPIKGYSESLVYDDLNRLTKATVFGSQWSVNNLIYDTAGLGNVYFKSGVGTYDYGEPHSDCPVQFAGPHAVTSATGGAMQGVMNYCYDLNGNIESAKNATGTEYEIAYTAFDKPNYLKRGSNEVTFKYGPARQRIQRTDNNTKTTTYVGGVYEKIEDGSSTEHKFYVGDYAIVSRSSELSPAQYSTHYLHRDHLGSVDVISDQNGVEVENQSFDAWGKRRRADWEADLDLFSFNSDYTPRGFTNHEHIDSIGLIHMNGRVYDPVLARFLSADPYISSQYNNQDYNRYSYVLNNPLSFTDPSGFTARSLGCGVDCAESGNGRVDLPPSFASGNFGDNSNAPNNVYIGAINLPPVLPVSNSVLNYYNQSSAATSASVNVYLANQQQAFQDRLQANHQASMDNMQARIDATMANIEANARAQAAAAAAEKRRQALFSSGGGGTQVALAPLAAPILAELASPVLYAASVKVAEGLALATVFFGMKAVDDSVNGDSGALSTEGESNVMAASGGGMFPGGDGDDNQKPLRPEAKYLKGKKHGLKWNEGPAFAKNSGIPQGQWGSRVDLNFAGRKASTLRAGEGGWFNLPRGHSSKVHLPNGKTVPASRIWVRNNGTGTFHGYPAQ